MSYSNVIGSAFITDSSADYDDDKIYSTIIEIFRVVDNDTPLVVAQQNIARPEWDRYGTLLIVNDQLVGLAETLERDIDGNTDIDNIVRQRRHATLSVNFYRKDAQKILNSFMAAWFSMGGLDIQRVQNMGFRGFSAVRNITTAVHSNFEDRAQVDLHISYIHQFNLTHDTIGTWNIGGEFVGDNDTTPILITAVEPSI